jgi:hypothetical protein
MTGPDTHTGRCDTGRPLCGKPARFYAAGYRCDEHKPHAYNAPAPAPAAGTPPGK